MAWGQAKDLFTSFYIVLLLRFIFFASAYSGRWTISCSWFVMWLGLSQVPLRRYRVLDMPARRMRTRLLQHYSSPSRRSQGEWPTSSMPTFRGPIHRAMTASRPKWTNPSLWALDHTPTPDWLPALQPWTTTIYAHHAVFLPTSTTATSSTSTSELPIDATSILHYHTEITFRIDTTPDNLSCQPWIHDSALWNSTVWRMEGCNFSCLISPDGSAPAPLASLLFDPPEPQNIGKT